MCTSPDTDFIIGKEVGTYTHFTYVTPTPRVVVRDMVLLGAFNLKPADYIDHLPLTLKARHIFTISKPIFVNTTVRAKGIEYFASPEAFKEKVLECLLDYLSMQKEAAQQIGLKPILSQEDLELIT